jgi:uncharacterized membrane protein (DUF485 family)
MNTSEKLGFFLGAMFLVVFASLILAFPTKWLWNACLVPAVTFAKPIGFLQALGLNFLTAILFKSNVKQNSSK